MSPIKRRFNGFFSWKDIVTLLVTMVGLFVTLFVRDLMSPYQRELSMTKVEITGRLRVIERDVAWIMDNLVPRVEFNGRLDSIKERLNRCESHLQAKAYDNVD